MDFASHISEESHSPEPVVREDRMTGILEVAHTEFSARLEDVEVRLAYQDQVIEDLNKVIVEQWSAMETFRRQIERLEEKMRDLQERPIPGVQDEPPPPHY